VKFALKTVNGDRKEEKMEETKQFKIWGKKLGKIWKIESGQVSNFMKYGLTPPVIV